MSVITGTDPAVLSAVIQSSGTIVATILAAVAAALIGRQFASRKKLQEKLIIAQRDIEFLLAVEEEHCEMHSMQRGESFKNRMRKSAKERKNVSWSGMFTPGRANNLRTRLSLQEKKID